MRLAQFILENIEPILTEWEAFARSLTPGTKMTKLALRDDAGAILLATAEEMQTAQSPSEQESKSTGEGGADVEASEKLDSASVLHGVGRVGSGFDMMEVVAEYRALRASVLRLWREDLPQPSIHDIDDITRFNESMDQSLSTAVESYTRSVDRSRRMFLAILSHDMRNPLHSIGMAASILLRRKPDPDNARVLAQIETNTRTVTRLVADLIDFASTGLGSAMPLTRQRVDLESLCREVVDGFRFAHPQRSLSFSSDGDLVGDWDAARLHQVVSNLLGNALQHGTAAGPIELSIASEGSTVVLRVHNEGEPIPPEMLSTIFNPLVRHASLETAEQQVAGSIGLGLYIVREIVIAHGGTVEVTSTAQEGTTFTVQLPRSLPEGDDRPDDENQ